MAKCKVLRDQNLYYLEEKINSFIQNKKNVQVNLSSFAVVHGGLKVDYTACITYEEEEK